MAIVNGEYGAYDDATGRPVSTTESGMVYSDTGEAYSQAPIAPLSYVTRGEYRLPKNEFGMLGGALEFMGDGGWAPVTAATAPSGYDPRQDSDTQGSNERLRFDQAFGSSPADVPITDLQQYAMANGWQEPDRSNNEGTLGAMFSNIAPYAGLMLGGIGAMGGFAGAAGGGGALDAATLATGDAMAGLIPASEVGAWAGTAAGAAGGGAYPWLDAAGNLDVDAFLQMTGPGGEYASVIPGGAEGVAAMDTLGSTSWLDSAINSLANGDTSWLPSGISPTQIKSLLTSALGGGGATAPRAGTGAGAGGGSGIIPFPVGQNKSILEIMMGAEEGNGLDEFMRLMAQSGKGVGS